MTYRCLTCNKEIHESDSHYATAQFAMMCGYCVLYGMHEPEPPDDDARPVEVAKTITAIYLSRADANEMRQRLVELAGRLVLDRIGVW